ncbi:suppressor of fused domain protein [Paenibacillus urinalis]|uniref:Suppressor of fused domain protein n=1 Tax=Paenibacillus urinalis TaxID=521520 RepID=A0ABY7X2W8_9BACL|nr:suppressor of fused domain protein [Paenibacillus urinalis]WDH96553.1 suppressor of fused domain protein [Paenibacillus urinalis]WDI00199.1 suppressor of fused domain protein [Paenibacillus urinalis]
MKEEEDMAPGWDAIEDAMTKLYGSQMPMHYGSSLPAMFGGDPLDGISVYKADHPAPHWHMVTFGFTELYGKEKEDKEHSGFGFELTFRLKRSETEEQPPAWAIDLLQNMGRYIYKSGNRFQSGDYLDTNGPICLGSDTKLTALCYTEDPELPSIETPNGRMEFIQMIGITGDERDAMQTWNSHAMLKICEPYMPYYITDLERSSLLMLPAVATAVEEGLKRDGSNTGFLYVSQLGWEPPVKRMLRKSPAVLTIGAKQAEIIGKMLSGRILKQNPLYLSGPNVRVALEPGDNPVIEEGPEHIRIVLDATTVAELSSKLRPKEELIKLSAFKGLTVQVAKTYIKDQQDNVVETIG